MKFNALRDFLAVAERGSLRAAARQLGSAQPALSHSIKELEKELGVVLFERRSTGVVLTDMGAAFHKRAASAMHDLRRATEELDQLRGEVHGNLAVAMSSVAHIALLPFALGAFRARYPKVQIDIVDAVYPGSEPGLLDGSLDLYIGPAPADVVSALQVEKLFDNTRTIVSRQGHPLAQARSLRELVDAEWITTSITHNAEEELGPLFAHHGLPAPRLVMKAHSALTFMVALANSDLLMMLPVQWIQSESLAPLLARIDVREPLPAPPVCLVRRAGLPPTPAAEYFCDMVRRAVQHMRAP